jgi:hypothetical protein
MIDWLYTWPEPLLVTTCAAVLAILTIVMPRFVQKVPFLRPTDAGFEFVIRMQAPLFTMTALILTFTLVEAERNFRQVSAEVATEASQINQLDRQLTRYDGPEAQAVRPLLRAYGRSIVQDEWKSMLRSGSSTATGAAYGAVSQAIFALDPKPGRQSLIYSEMLKSLDVVAESRSRRLDGVNVGLPTLYWQVILFAVTMVLFVGSTIQQTPYRTSVLAAQMAVLGCFVGFTFVMDAPFKGETAVNSDAIIQALDIMEKRQK